MVEFIGLLEHYLLTELVFVFKALLFEFSLNLTQICVPSFVNHEASQAAFP